METPEGVLLMSLCMFAHVESKVRCRNVRRVPCEFRVSPISYQLLKLSAAGGNPAKPEDWQTGSEPLRPVFLIHGPQGASVESKRKMVKGINAAVAEAYDNPLEFIIFIPEHPLELVAVNGNLHADNQKRAGKGL